MKKIKEVSILTGLSVRTLQFYDKKGILKPRYVNDEGYRFYDDENIEMLGQIVILKELDFSLKDIKRFMGLKYEDRILAIGDQIELLKMRKKRTEDMIDMAEKIRKGEFEIVDIKKADRKEYELCQEEARERWGKTDEYRQSQERYGKKSDEEKELINSRMMEIFREFGKLKDTDPSSDKAMKKAAELKAFITENWYDCSDEMLMNLGLMYTEDERFRDNIDSAGGEGTAAFTRNAIEEYVRSVK